MIKNDWGAESFSQIYLNLSGNIAAFFSPTDVCK